MPGKNVSKSSFNTYLYSYSLILENISYIWIKYVTSHETSDLGGLESGSYCVHRMFGVGRDLYGSSSPTLLPKQGHLQQAAEDLVQVGLEYLQ